MTHFVTASEVAAMLADGREIALLDVREIVPFGTGHPLLATNLPLSHLELSIGKLVPRVGTRIVVTDGGGSHAGLAAERLEKLGYSNVAIMEGGAPAWAAAGLTLFPEIEVPTKGFGAFARRYGGPTFITPHELNRALRADEDWIVLDSRPPAEYRKGNIPGSIDAPGADVVRCFDDLVPNPSTKVVVNCMSATRGILGGLSLIAAGVPNDVYVLLHGTRGWLLDGLELEAGANRFPVPVSTVAREHARARVARIAERAGISRIDSATIDRWRRDDTRTTYIFDVRSPGEYAAGHLSGSYNAPQGAIVMSPDRYFATLQARIVLVDDDTVRATITALWLTQMGWGDVVVLVDALDSHSLEIGPEPAPDIGLDVPSVRQLTAYQIDALRRSQAIRIIDVGTSEGYVGGHLPEAVWCSRVALGALLREQVHDGPTVLTSEQGLLARLSVRDLDTSLLTDISLLAGGNAAWRDAGLSLASGAENLVSPRDDHWLASSERPGDTRQNVIAYLEWEETLLDDIERAGMVPYRNLIWR